MFDLSYVPPFWRYLALHSDLTRLLLSACVVVMCLGLYRVVLGRLQQGNGDVVKRRTRFVWMRNALVFTAVGALVTIWATKIAGFALSLAAIAAAVLIISKEFISNLLGWTVLTFARTYSVGDFIEIAGQHGRVIDINAMVTTLAVTRDANQITGRTAVIPNAMLLTQVVHNFSMTGQFAIHLLRISVAPERMAVAQAQLLEIAKEVSAPWRSRANEHFQHIERSELVDLPSAEPKVLIDLSQAKEPALIVRFVCEPNLRVRIEQELLKLYLAKQHSPLEPPLRRPFRVSRRAP